MKKIANMKDTRSGWYLVTPQDARAALERQGKNRPLVESRVNAIAEAIRAGQWISNGESVVMAHDDTLLDGQHRYRACIVANRAIQVYVVYLPKNPSEEFFDSMDQGKSRTAADRLALDGVRHQNLAAAITRQLLLWDRYGRVEASDSSLGSGTGGTRDTIKITIPDVRRYYLAHKSRVDDASMAVALFQNLLKGWARGSLVGFVYAQGLLLSRVKADEFIKGFATGENLRLDSPVLQLRRKLQQDALNRARIATRDSLALIIKAWNLYYTGRVVKVLSFQPTVESFPHFVGLDDGKPDKKGAA